MNDFVLRMLRPKLLHIFEICRVILWIQSRSIVNLTSKANNFIIVIAFLRSVRQKVELNSLTINIPIIIHQHRFQPSAMHVIYNL